MMDPELWEHRMNYGPVRALAFQLREAEQVALDWANSAGWATGHGDTLADILREMRAQHAEEREAD